MVVVDGEQQIAAHPFRIATVLGFRDDTIPIGVDDCEHFAQDFDARGKAHLYRNVIPVHGERGSLQVFIQPVCARWSRHRQGHHGEKRKYRFHLLVNARP
jgi:hypothetical protein